MGNLTKISNGVNNKIILLAIIIAGVLVAGAIVYTNYSKCPEIPGGGAVLPAQEAGQKLIDFVNQNILQGKATASLIESFEEDGFYKVKFNVEGQEVEWRITKDGRFVFPQVIDLAELAEPVEGTEGEFSLENLENFAKCLKEKGMKFYGASGCGWCQKQKELFGEVAQYLPYIECMNEETNELTTECQEAGISGFPTWELPDGEKSSGFKSLEELSQLSGCPLE